VAVGVYLEHTNYTHQVPSLYTIPIISQPLYVNHPAVAGKDNCPTCGVIHPVKTVHLNLGSDGRCIVSEGVLKLIKEKANPDGGDGLAFSSLRVAGTTDNPPPLALNGRNGRAELDQQNLRIQEWTV
jgi:hypothetical protein